MKDAAGAVGGGGGAVAGAGSSHAANISAAAAVTRSFLSIALSLPPKRCNGSRCFGYPHRTVCLHPSTFGQAPLREGTLSNRLTYYWGSSGAQLQPCARRAFSFECYKYVD